jgi:hypothetical protein
MVRRGISMMEVVISTALLGLVVAAGLNAAGQSARAAYVTEDVATAAWLADSLLAEMLDAPAFDEKDVKQGPEDGEDRRDKFDNVNDYHGWTGKPPVTIDGDPMAGVGDFTRRAAVWGVDPADPGKPTTMGDDALVLIVIVGRGSSTLVERRAVRTRGMGGQ